MPLSQIPAFAFLAEAAKARIARMLAAPKTELTPPRTNPPSATPPALRVEIAAWNAEVDRRKAAKRAAKLARRAQA